jgi:hypothetical protein
MEYWTEWQQAENDRLRAELDKKRTTGYSCACLINDKDEILRWCGIHAKMRDEHTKYRELVIAEYRDYEKEITRLRAALEGKP